jgi:hypothetical protein
MLPAEKRENHLSAVAANSNVSSASGFGKVLGSIQGLQQRLNDFTLDDIIGAENNLKSLMQQVVLMRDRFDTIAEMKHAVTNANQLILTIPEESFDLVGPDSLEKHPKLHAIVKASKLIRLQKLMKAAKASADGVSFDADAGMLHFDNSAPHNVVAPLSDETTQAEKTLAGEVTRSKTENFIPIGATDQGQAIVIEAPAEWPLETASSEMQYSSAANVEPASDFNLVSADESTPVEADVKLFGGQDVSDANPHTFASPESPTDAVVEAANNDSILAEVLAEAPANSLVTQATPIAPSPKPDAGDAERHKHLSRKEKKQARQKKRAETESTIEESKALVPAESKVNRQLLDDLIESYGDFALTPNLPAPIQAPTLPQIKSVEPSVMPAPEFEKPVQETRSAPNLQKAGELDRQLKKIIKDYGEYDLYSKQSSVNLKTGGIVVFVILGLVLGGLYLFKAPATVSSSPSHDVTQPTQSAPADPLKSTLDAKRGGAGISGNRERPTAAAKTVTKQNN